MPVPRLSTGCLVVVAVCAILTLHGTQDPSTSAGLRHGVSAAACLAVAAASTTRAGRRAAHLPAGLCLVLAAAGVLDGTVGLPGSPAGRIDAAGTVALGAEALVVLRWLGSADRGLRRTLRGLTVGAVGLGTVVLTPLGEGRPADPAPATGHQHAGGHAAARTGDARPGAVAPGLLEEQLAAAREAAARWPTLGTAQAQGWTRADTYVAGTGAHWMHYEDIDGSFDPAAPEMLLFGGDGPDAPLVGLTYYVVFTAPEGFTGDADVWHQHKDVCVGPEGPLFAGDGMGRCKSPSEWSWMLHAWVVPGWENPAGVFAMENVSV
jgi:hypothetical protein